MLRNLTQRFNSSFLKQVNTSIIVASMVNLLHIGDESIEKLIIQTFVNLCTSSKDMFSDEVMKYEQTCSVNLGELSLWKWVCDQS